MAAIKGEDFLGKVWIVILVDMDCSCYHFSY